MFVNVNMWYLFACVFLFVTGMAEEYDRNILFRFTSKSCGICERYSKEWDEIAELDSDSTRTIDCDKDIDFCLEQNIRSYPTFKLYSKYEGFHDFYDYEDIEIMKTFVTNLNPKSCYESNTCSSEFKNWLASNPDMSFENALYELKNTNNKFTTLLQNITTQITHDKTVAYEKVDYIYNYKNEL